MNPEDGPLDSAPVVVQKHPREMPASTEGYSAIEAQDWLATEGKSEI